jgi:hypothetical protein
MADRQDLLLRAAFLLGALTDAVALIPMLSPSAANLMWGIEATSGAYRFAMGYGASLMFGWTLLLLWAYRRPLERRVVAALTVLVIYGLLAAEVATVLQGDIAWWRMAPTWFLQALLLSLFAGAYHYASVRRWLAARV